jgi:hypothetical protein
MLNGIYFIKYCFSEVEKIVLEGAVKWIICKVMDVLKWKKLDKQGKGDMLHPLL